jgi:hypothetical protein
MRVAAGKEVRMRRRAWTRMTQLTALAVGLGVAAGAAWADQQQGTVKSVDQSRKTVVLSDGTQLWLVPGLSLDLFAQGKRVKVVYDEREGKKWVRSVEAAN